MIGGGNEAMTEPALWVMLAVVFGVVYLGKQWIVHRAQEKRLEAERRRSEAASALLEKALQVHRDICLAVLDAGRNER